VSGHRFFCGVLPKKRLEGFPRFPYKHLLRGVAGERPLHYVNLFDPDLSCSLVGINIFGRFIPSARTGP